ncbi:MAG TPA: carboxypeptidase-like regulatory domain-containing protein [Candidatus Woesebacteria bacterium]|nr:carboxypeptidase-like regulatory domain-containing protein [Candidatus Woesebacteria bacterium]
MTLRQFAKLAACCLVALVFYGLDLPSLIKYAAVGFFVLLGAGLAFLPINERPLDVWIISFFKAIFSPTQYIWKKKDLTPPPQSLPTTPTSPVTPSVPPATTVRESPNLASSPISATNNNRKEEDFLQNIQSLFASGPIIKPRIEKLNGLEVKPANLEERIAAVAPVMAKGKVSPFFTDLPNIINGVIKDKQGKLIDGVILEIKDVHDLAVRALRSNKLGQFRIATPLPDGAYTLYPEKEGLEFDIIKVELKGQVFPPIEISAKQTP